MFVQEDCSLLLSFLSSLLIKSNVGYVTAALNAHFLVLKWIFKAFTHLWKDPMSFSAF